MKELGYEGMLEPLGKPTIIAELWALRDGLNLAIKLGLNKLVIELDGLSVVTLMNNDSENFFVIQNHEGAWIRGYARALGKTSSIIAKLWALRDWLNLEIELGLNKLIIDLDALSVVTLMNNDSEILFVIRNHEGAWIRGYARALGKTNSIIAELWAFRDGLNLAIELGLNKLTIELDALSVVTLLNIDSENLFVIRNHERAWIRGYARALRKTNSIIAELWALRDGLNLAIELGLNKLIIELDALSVVTLMNNDSENLLMEPLLTDCRNLSKAIPNKCIIHTYREANQCVDTLAKLGANSLSSFCCLL